jgi:hypothetical protein
MQVSTHPKRPTPKRMNELIVKDKKATASAKSKELQPNSQIQPLAAHLLLPQFTTTFVINLKTK